jgi:hypothetical protein
MSDEDLSAALLEEGCDALLVVRRVDAGSKLEPSWTQILGAAPRPTPPSTSTPPTTRG